MTTTRGTRLIDLSLEVFHGLALAGNTKEHIPSPIIAPLMTHESTAAQELGEPDDRFTFAVNLITMVDHTGTHVDALSHIKPGGTPIDEMPLEWFTGKAVCLDVRHVGDRGDVDVADLVSAQEACGIALDGHIVLICTGHYRKHWPHPEVRTMNPGLTAAATHWLADRGTRVYGVDGPSADVGGQRLFPSHRVCRDRGLVHYEWLVNLEELVGVGEFQFHGLPIRWRQGTGSPVRAVAEVRA